MDKQLAARRLSEALGRKVDPEEIRFSSDSGTVLLESGEVYGLAGGNSCHAGAGKWFCNGQPWDIKPGERVKSL